MLKNGNKIKAFLKTQKKAILEIMNASKSTNKYTNMNNDSFITKYHLYLLLKHIFTVIPNAINNVR